MTEEKHMPIFYTVEELEAMLKRKKKESMPKRRTDAEILKDLPMFVERLDTHLLSFIEGDYDEDDDTDHHVYEKAMEFIYGKEIFNWINAQLRY